MTAGSVSGGAAMLHVSAPAVSRLLSHLESRLAVPLFERRGSRLHPTPEAQALMREIDGAYRHIDRVRQAAAALRQGGGARLRVCSNLSTALELLPRALARLRQRLPALRLTIDVAPLARMREGLETGEFDLGVGAFIELDAGALQRRRVGEGELLAVLPPAHPLAALPAVTPAALRDEDVIAYGLAGTHGRQIQRLVGREGREPAVEVPYAYMACALVACGQGVAVVDDLTLRHFHDTGVQTRPLAPALHYAVDVLSDPRRAAPAAAAALVEALRAEWGQLSAAPGPARRRRTRHSPASG